MSTQTTGSRRAARRASRRPQAQYLLTADEHSLTELELSLAALPLCAVGRVFIEVPSATEISVITAPPRMTVTWLTRARGQNAAARPAGVLLAAAASAWADEMLCDESGSGLRTEVTLLGDYLSTADIVEHLSERCTSAVAISTPARLGLSLG